jgi:hypothetical protein
MVFFLSSCYHTPELITPYLHLSSVYSVFAMYCGKKVVMPMKPPAQRDRAPAWGNSLCTDNSVDLCLTVKENRSQSWSASSSNRPIQPIGSTRRYGLILLRASPLMRSPSALALPPGVFECSATSAATPPNDPSSSNRAKAPTVPQNVTPSATTSLLCASKTSPSTISAKPSRLKATA